MHELHLWQLNERKTIATCHLVCDDSAPVMEVSKMAKNVFHQHNVHATTIQIENATDEQDTYEPFFAQDAEGLRGSGKNAVPRKDGSLPVEVV